MIINEFSSLEFWVFLRYQTSPILLNLIFLSVWIPVLSYFFLKNDRKDKSYLYLALAYFSLFSKEIIFFFLSRRIVFNMSLSRVDFSATDWVLFESVHLFLFFYFIFLVFKDEINFKGKELNLPFRIFERNQIFSKWGLIGCGLLVVSYLIVHFFVEEFSDYQYFFLLAVLTLIGTTVSFYLFINAFRRDFRYLSTPWFPKPRFSSTGASSPGGILTSIFSLNTFSIAQLIMGIALFYFAILYLIPPTVLGDHNLVNFDELLNESKTYFHGYKSFLYFLLLVSLVQFLKNKTNANRIKQEVQELTLTDLEKFNGSLEKKKLSYSQPKTLINSFLDYFIEKFQAEVAIISLEGENILKINLQSQYYSFKSWKSTAPTLDEQKKYFPYLDVIYKENRRLFIDNFSEQSMDFQEHYPYLMEELLSRDSVRINSLISFPIFITDKEERYKEERYKEEQERSRVGTCVIINRVGGKVETQDQAWRLENAFSFLKIMFPVLQNVIHYYNKEYEDQIRKRNQMLDKRILDSQNELIHRLERKYSSDLKIAGGITEEKTGDSAESKEVGKKVLDAHHDAFFPTKPRNNLITYFRAKNQDRVILHEVKGVQAHLPSAHLILKQFFLNSKGQPKNTVEESQNLGGLFGEEISLLSTMVTFDQKERKLKYALNSTHPILIYRSRKKKFDIIGSVKDYEDIEGHEKFDEAEKEEVSIDFNELKIEGDHLTVVESVSGSKSKRKKAKENEVKKDVVIKPSLDSGTVELQKGDLFVLSSRELFWLRNADREIFNFEKLAEIFKNNHQENASTIARRVRQVVASYNHHLPASYQVFFIGKVS